MPVPELAGMAQIGCVSLMQVSELLAEGPRVFRLGSTFCTRQLSAVVAEAVRSQNI
jgi:hypothetical protein